MTRLHYSIADEVEHLAGDPIYLRNDHAFDFLPADAAAVRQHAGKLGTTSVVLDTLQLDVGIETGLCLWVHGYSPTTGWNLRSVVPPPSQAGGLRCSAEDGLRQGVSIRAMVGKPSVYFDTSSGWFCAAATQAWPRVDGERAVQIATDTLALVSPDELLALFVRPRNWQDLAQMFRKNKCG